MFSWTNTVQLCSFNKMTCHWFSSLGCDMEVRPCSFSPRFFCCTFSIFTFAPTLSALEQMLVSANAWPVAKREIWQLDWKLGEVSEGCLPSSCQGCAWACSHYLLSPRLSCPRSWWEFPPGIQPKIQDWEHPSGVPHIISECLEPQLTPRKLHDLLGLFLSQESEPEFLWTLHLLRAVRISTFPNIV